MTTQEILRAAAAVRPRLALLTEAEKNAALASMADALVESTAEILAANAIDKENAKGKISDVMIDTSGAVLGVLLVLATVSIILRLRKKSHDSGEKI